MKNFSVSVRETVEQMMLYYVAAKDEREAERKALSGHQYEEADCEEEEIVKKEVLSIDEDE